MFDITADEATRLKSMSPAERAAERVNLIEEAERLQHFEHAGTLSRAQEARYNEALGAITHIDKLNKHDEIREAAKDPRRVISYSTGSNTTSRSGPFGSQRDGAARVVDEAFRSGDLPDHAAETVTKLLDEGREADQSLAARWATAVGDPAYRDAFVKLMADPDKGHLMWNARELAAYQTANEVRTAMSLTDGNGGHLVPLTLDPSVLITSAGSINPMRQVARQVKTMTDTWKGVTSAGVTAEWLAEGVEAADAGPTLAGPEIPTFKGSAFVPYSYEVDMDARNFLPEIAKLLTDGYEQLLATAFVTGNGTTAPKGFVTALDGTASEVAPTTVETFAAADLYKLIEAVPARFRANAAWQANLSILNLIDQFETTNGSKKFPELENNRLLRKPVYENSNMDGSFSAAATADNFLLAVGDWAQSYVIVDRIGSTIELIPNLVGTNRRPTGQRGAFLWGRVGGDAVNINGLRLLNVATTA